MAVGICTFRRPEGLEAVLNAIARQVFYHCPEPEIEVIVVDNDADPAIEKYVNDFAAKHSLKLRYLAEPRRGISQARNCIIRNVPESADLVAFLDDDEVPIDCWLDNLIYGLIRSGADAVSGPVLPEYVKQPPKWMLDGKFFSSPRRKFVNDFEPVRFGVMGNFLMRRLLLEDDRLYFPEELGLVGSEDNYFFSTIQSMNAVMSWASQAVVIHQVPLTRMSLRYLLMREFRVGCGKTLALCLSGPRRSRMIGQFAGDFLHLVVKLTVLLPSLIFGYFQANHYKRMKPIFDVWQYAGRLYGLFGFRYQQYK